MVIATHQEIEVINEDTPLVHSSATASYANHRSIRKPADEPVLYKRSLVRIKSKLLLSVVVATVIFGLLCYLFTPADVRDHCVRHGYKTSKTSPIPFNTSSFAVFLDGDASSGIVRVTQLAPNDPKGGSMSARINTYPGNLIDKTNSILDMDQQETRVSITLPDLLHSKACVYVEVELYVPAYTTSLFIDGTRNVEVVANTALSADFVEMYTYDAPIQLLQGWTGQDITLSTTNADFNFSALHATRSIALQNVDGPVRLDGSSSGSIRPLSYSVEVRNTALISWIGPVAYNVSLEDTRASNITVHRGRADLDHVTVNDTLTAKTKNGAIHAYLDGSQDIHIKFETDGGDVNRTMPDDFGGHIAVYSSSAADLRSNDWYKRA